MRDINDIKKEFKTEGNTNGHYQQLQKHVRADAVERFKRKPYHLLVAEKMRQKEANDV